MGKGWRRIVLMALLLTLLTGCDQATKGIASSQLKDAPPRSYAGDLLRIQYSENTGAFLSLGARLPPAARTALFTVGTGALLLLMLTLVLRYGRPDPLAWAGFALYLGGGLGNLADRLLNSGTVVDFMNVGIGPVRSGIFNFADLFIMAGALILLLAAFRANGEARAG